MSDVKPINVSFWEKWPEWKESILYDFLWHDQVEQLPQLGTVLTILNVTFKE